jgi:phosphopantothenoylcysteine decarboxylase/phosphopantothenate--cysteine ligase
MTAASSVAVVRHPDLVALRSRSQCRLVRPGVRILNYQDHAAEIVARLVEEVATPLAVRALLDRLSGTDRPRLERLIETLLDRGMLMSADREPEPAVPVVPLTLGRVVVAACGAVQAMHLLSFLDPLVRAPDTEVQVVLTDATRRFIEPASLTHAYGLRPWLGLDDRRDGVISPHITLAEWADIIVVLPTTAHLLHRLATGATSDLLSLILMATSAPVVLVPSMNAALWRHPAISRNVRQVVEDGAHVIIPAAGYAVANGPLSEPEIGALGVQPRHLPRLLRLVADLASTHEDSNTVNEEIS